MSTSSLTLHVARSSSGDYRIRVIGTLDTSTCPEYDRVMDEVLIDPSLKSVCLELEGLEFISSMGLGVVFRTRKTVEGRRAVFLMTGVQPQIAKVFQIVRMLPGVSLFATREEADHYLAEIQRKVREGEIPS